MKISYTISANRAAALNDLMIRTGVKTKNELIDNAVSVLEWLVEEKNAGRTVGSIDNEKNIIREIVLPALTELR